MIAADVWTGTRGIGNAHLYASFDEEMKAVRTPTPALPDPLDDEETFENVLVMAWRCWRAKHPNWRPSELAEVSTFAEVLENFFDEDTEPPSKPR